MGRLAHKYVYVAAYSAQKATRPNGSAVTKTLGAAWWQKAPMFNTAQTQEKRRFGEPLVDLMKLVGQAAVAGRGVTGCRSTRHRVGRPVEDPQLCHFDAEATGIPYMAPGLVGP